MDKKKPIRLIAVGDRVSRNIIKSGVLPDVTIVDNKVMRKHIVPFRIEADETYFVKNPAGTLTDESWSVTKKAINLKNRVTILVDGEEDLFALVAVISAPKGSIVVYGQPKEGIVIIEVTEVTKKKFHEIIKRMERNGQ